MPVDASRQWITCTMSLLGPTAAPYRLQNIKFAEAVGLKVETLVAVLVEVLLVPPEGVLNVPQPVVDQAKPLVTQCGLGYAANSGTELLSLASATRPLMVGGAPCTRTPPQP